MTPRRRMLIAAVVAAGVSWLVPWALAPARFHYAPPTATLETAAFAVVAAPREAADATPDEAPPETFAETAPAPPDATRALAAPEADAPPALPEASPGASAAAIAPAWDARLTELAGLGELGARAGEGAPDFALPPMPGAPGAGAPVVGDSAGPLLLAPPDLAAHYPYAARARGTTGATRVRLTVSAAGAVTAVEVAESSPPGVFEEAARRLGRALRFRPALANGRPVPARVELRLNWRLDGASQ